jgi:hypothetical protein
MRVALKKMPMVKLPRAIPPPPPPMDEDILRDGNDDESGAFDGFTSLLDRLLGARRYAARPLPPRRRDADDDDERYYRPRY